LWDHQQFLGAMYLLVMLLLPPFAAILPPYNSLEDYQLEVWILQFLYQFV
jgi:hypothetical protein